MFPGNGCDRCFLEKEMKIKIKEEQK